MIAPILQSALSGLSAASNSVDRAAAQVTRFAEAPSFSSPAATVQISPQARAAAPSSDTTGDLAGALVNMNVAKYAFVANLKVVQAGDDMTRDLLKLA
ncbi:MAG TPA: hypothetical protein VK745_18945 [Polyangiaceae bacterium]|jgi:hypothetical protein|nr:hypothetical protein [Polyangiaceae bacterium]